MMDNCLIKKYQKAINDEALVILEKVDDDITEEEWQRLDLMDRQYKKISKKAHGDR